MESAAGVKQHGVKPHTADLESVSFTRAMAYSLLCVKKHLSIGGVGSRTTSCPVRASGAVEQDRSVSWPHGHWPSHTSLAEVTRRRRAANLLTFRGVKKRKMSLFEPPFSGLRVTYALHSRGRLAIGRNRNFVAIS